jgi:hypothetical protein
VDKVKRPLDCCKHGTQFSLMTDKPLQLLAPKATPVRPVDVRSGDAVLTLP